MADDPALEAELDRFYQEVGVLRLRQDPKVETVWWMPDGVTHRNVPPRHHLRKLSREARAEILERLRESLELYD
jgi:hypothetical protein